MSYSTSFRYVNSFRNVTATGTATGTASLASLVALAMFFGVQPNISRGEEKEKDKESAEGRDLQFTIVLRGAATTRDLPVLLKALRATKGVQVHTDDVELGFRKFNNRFTTPIVVTFPQVPGDDDSNIGALATAVSNAKTPSRDEYPPGVNLILFTDDQLKETSISSLRSALSNVNGVEVSRAGGLGASIQDGWCWVRLEDAGGAMLLDIEKNASESGTEYRRLKEPLPARKR